MSAARSLEDLLAKDAIIDVLARYSRTLDWLDDEGQASCFWPDAAIDYGFFRGSAADFIPAVMAIERRSARRWHLFSPPAIRLIDDGRYLDAFEKRGAEWRITRRNYVLDWSNPLLDQPVFDPASVFPLPILEILQSGHPQYRTI